VQDGIPAITMFRAASAFLRRAPIAKSPNHANTTQVRFLNIHEYQSHDLMKVYGISTPRGKVAASPEEAATNAAQLIDAGVQDIVVKAQVLAGGRGLGVFTNGFKGGVHMCSSPDEAKGIASKMIGQRLMTKQTGAEGRPVNKVYVTERVYLRKEMYFAILMDRKSGGPVLVGSPRGGVDIEGVAATTPELIFQEPIDITKGVQQEQVLRLAKNMGFSSAVIPKAAEQMKRLYDLFISRDNTLVEINPLAETPTGEVLCVDAKLNFDDNAFFRQKDIFALRDVSQEDPREVAAAQFDLNYIGLDGTIGCLVNGAGLAMATMDIIKLHGGSPANFLDVGGGANAKQVTEAFKILNSDPRVQAILVNIFGGIMRCDIIAQGIVQAAREISMRVPIVVRLQGTNAEEAKKLIAESNVHGLIPQDDLDLAAKTAVGVADICKMGTDLGLRVAIRP